MQLKISSPKQWFDELLPAKLVEDPDCTGGFEGTIAFQITGTAGGEWTAHLGSDGVTVENAAREGATLKVAIADSDFVSMINGDSSGQDLFMTGRLTLQGDVSQAMKLQRLLF